MRHQFWKKTPSEKVCLTIEETCANSLDDDHDDGGNGNHDFANEIFRSCEKAVPTLLLVENDFLPEAMSRKNNKHISSQEKKEARRTLML